MKVVTFIHNYVVTKNLREATLQAYLNPHHFYNLHTKDVHTHSVRVITYLILVVVKLSDATIKHRPCWALSAWKLYLNESLYDISQAYNSSF